MAQLGQAGSGVPPCCSPAPDLDTPPGRGCAVSGLVAVVGRKARPRLDRHGTASAAMSREAV